MATNHAADANQPAPLFSTGSPLSVPHLDDTLSGGGEMGARIRGFDWSTSPLGPADTWPRSLLTAVSICLASRFPVLIWWGPDLIMLYNDAYRPLLGQRQHPDALGHAGHACWPETWDTIGPMLTSILRRGASTWSDDQLLLLDRNGYLEECYFTFSHSPIRDESGEVGGVFTTATETTSAVLGARRLRTLRKLAAASLDINATLALDERAQRIAWHVRAVVGARQVAAWVALNGDDDPLVAASNLDDQAPAVTRALGALPQLAAGNERLRHPLRLTGRAVAEDVAMNALAYLLGGAGRGWLSAPLIARAGRTIGLVMAADKADSAVGDFSAEDEHMLVQLAQLAASALENAALFEEIQAANAMRDAALFMVTHDLKQPLTAVKANVQMLQRQARRAEHLESARVRARLATIDETADKMTSQINELLDVARLQAGQPLELEREPVELVAFVAQLVDEQRQTAARHTIRVDAEITALAGVWDAPRLARVLGNLLSNAVKYSPRGGEIVLRVRREEPPEGEAGGPWAVVSVADQGMGIPPADLPHIFEPFRRASNAAKSTISGTGIGLASARNVVLWHGGTLTARSELGVGTTFTVRLPLAPLADATDAPADA